MNKERLISSAFAVTFFMMNAYAQSQYPTTYVTNDLKDQSETAIAISPSNPSLLMSVWNDFHYGNSKPGYAFSTDGGNSWTTEDVIPAHDGYTNGVDPSAAFDRYGNAYYCYIASLNGGYGPIYVSKTTTFQPPVSWSHKQVSDLTSQDKPYMTVDNTGGTRDGRIYVSWTDKSVETAIKFAYSTNQGISYSTPILLASETSGIALVQGSVPAVGPNGDLFVIWLEVGNNVANSYVKLRKSTDGGLNFGPAKTIAQLTWITQYIGKIEIAHFPSIAIDPNTGVIYVSYSNGFPVRLKWVRSTDGGDSWSSPLTIADLGVGWQFFPWVTVDPSGRVSVAFMHSADLTLVDSYIVESFNGGITFGSPVRISYPSTNPNYAGPQHHYLGVASTIGYTYPLWTDYYWANPILKNADVAFARVNRIPTSNMASALAGNNQRKIARDGNSTDHLVFESNQEIWYARRTSTDTEWNNYNRLSNGLSDGAKTNPSIYARGGHIFVVWQKYTGSSHDITFHKSTDGGATWPTGNRKVIASAVGSNPPLPVISSPAAGLLMMVYRTATNLSYRTSADNGNNWLAAAAVPSSGAAGNSPTLAVTTSNAGYPRTTLVNAATGGNGAIFYRYFIHEQDSTGWTSLLKNLSQIVPGTYIGHKNPSLAPKGNSSAGLHVAWEANSSPNGVIIHRKATDCYTWPSAYSVTYYQEQQLPSITGLSSDNAMLLFQNQTGGPAIYKMSYFWNGSTWTWGAPVYVASGTNPSASIIPLGITTAKYVWTGTAAAAPYQIHTSSETLSKSNKQLAGAYHRSIAIIDTTTSHWLEVRLDKLAVKTKSGEEFTIPFAEAKEDDNTLTPANAFANLASSSIRLPADAESLFVYCQVNGQGLSAIKKRDTAINVEMTLSIKNGTTSRRPVLNASAESLPETKRRLELAASNFAGKEFSLRMQVSGLDNKSSLIASLGHIYEIVEAPVGKVLSPIAENTTTTDYALSAYPNPFNPSTQVHFTIKETGRVAVRVYNLGGQLIRELVNEPRAVGEHIVLWDGNDARGAGAASGVYFIRLEARHEVKLSKIMLVR